MNSLQEYLRAYYKKQNQILLVYRPSIKHSWGNRCFYLGENYDQEVMYNHRVILSNEIIVEFDDEDPMVNEDLAKKVSTRLKRDKIRHSMWDSGNKSVHIHFFVNPKTAGNVRLLKKVIMRHYTEGLPVKPDMRLAVETHLIRAEYGVHEKSGRRKRPVFKSNDCMRDNDLPNAVWQKYANARTTVIKRKTSQDLSNVECSCISYIANSVAFRENGDGRERALWILLHTLKHKYTKEELSEYLQDWYKYSGGYKMDSSDINDKVMKQYRLTYGTFTMVKELLEELGHEDKLNECEIHKTKGD